METKSMNFVNLQNLSHNPASGFAAVFESKVTRLIDIDVDHYVTREIYEEVWDCKTNIEIAIENELKIQTKRFN
jgi:hypothetical protein